MENVGIDLTTSRTTIAASVTLMLGLVCGGCFGGPKKTVRRFVAPPPIPQANLVPSPTVPLDERVPVPPEFEVASLEAADLTITLPAYTPPKPPPRQQPRAIVVPPSPAPPPVANTAPGPQLEELLSPAQRKQAEFDFQAAIQRAQASLARTARRRLTASQRITVDRIRVFLTQAESERNRDITTALQFARRADLLGQDLLQSLAP